MGVRIDISLDLDGNHTFTWEPSDDPQALKIPEAQLQHWRAERQAFLRAQQRWHRVVDEIEAYLHGDLESETRHATAASAHSSQHRSV